MDSEADEEYDGGDMSVCYIHSSSCPVLPCLSTRGHATGRLDSGKLFGRTLICPTKQCTIVVLKRSFAACPPYQDSW